MKHLFAFILFYFFSFLFKKKRTQKLKIKIVAKKMLLENLNFLFKKNLLLRQKKKTLKKQTLCVSGCIVFFLRLVYNVFSSKKNHRNTIIQCNMYLSHCKCKNIFVNSVSRST